MEVTPALASQYRAGLQMLILCVEKCPDELWTAGSHPRAYWRIAYHALFYTHFYLMPNSESFTPWEKHVDHGRILWEDPQTGPPPIEHPYIPADLVAYAHHILENLDAWLAAIDLTSPESGFAWYPISKLEHQLVNIRHLGVHVGQLQERLYEVGIDPGWVGRG